jgi:PAS domain S-box-containing protein
MACLRDRRSFHAEVRVKRRDGEWRWVEPFGRPRVSSTGEFLGIAGSSPDITEQGFGGIAA